MQISGSGTGKFHLKDGRTLVFHAVQQSTIGRRAGEILLAAVIAGLGLLVATLFAKGHPDARAASRSNEPAISVR
jgi:hypothetical protein